MRKFFLLALSFTLLLLLGYAGYLSYSKSKEARLMDMAHRFMAQSDKRNATLSLLEVLHIDPRNVEATRLMADLAESDRQANALLWRNRVVQLDPNSSTDRIALASAALMAGDFALATNSLAQVGPAYQKTASYQNDAGVLAITTHQPALAEAYFREAALLDPRNATPQLNYAVLQLHSTNLAAVADARKELAKLAAGTNGDFRSQALRELTADAYVHGQFDTALRLSQRLLTETNSQFSDRILQLDILKRTDSSNFATTLDVFQTGAGNDPARIFELADWEIKNISPGQTLSWMGRLPLATQTNQPVALLSAECRMLQHDWRGLGDTLKTQYWGNLDFVRHAFEARAFEGRQSPDGKTAEWQKALQFAGNGLKNLTVLLQLSSEWNWSAEKEDLLWQIVRDYPAEKWASSALMNDLVVGGRTQSLMMLSARQLQQDPSDIQAKNNLAMTALLLNAREQKPFNLAREVYEANPTNISFASTYAFSLYRQNKSPEALKIFQQFSPKDFADPEVAGYYGLVLQATGHSRRAKILLDKAAQARILLPEERKLFAATH
jgi:Flp pilus assembly protein TadD